jgi:hypothetical protein
LKYSDLTIFHAMASENAAPHIRQFSGTINLGSSIEEDKRSDINLYILLKRFMAFAKHNDGSAQCITNPSNTPTTKECIELFYQHHIVADGIRGSINVSMSKTMGNMKDVRTPFRKYLNKDKVYVYQASLGLVDGRIIVMMLQKDPNLTFRDDIKTSIYDIMQEDTPISVFTKRVREVNVKSDNPRFTNGLAILVAIKDGNKQKLILKSFPKLCNL